MGPGLDFTALGPAFFAAFVAAFGLAFAAGADWVEAVTLGLAKADGLAPCSFTAPAGNTHMQHDWHSQRLVHWQARGAKPVPITASTTRNI